MEHGRQKEQETKKVKENEEDWKMKGWGGGSGGGSGCLKWGSEVRMTGDKMKKGEDKWENAGKRDLPQTYHVSIQDCHSAFQLQQIGPILDLQWDTQCQRDTRNPVQKVSPSVRFYSYINCTVTRQICTNINFLCLKVALLSQNS